nr:immunoglobulin light chain junction region [Macaca mulatta]MPN92203.1 immunoglobulin light chain junction region [Macaca mulatta]MPN93583.1 immunoglobulin light chain junction region [Macaca mulatta]MPN93979.1 immunoglobulin light chain junction region [Macaca mulatta]MPN94140.1 immunoglobulin light chain junction region [Macaca mulatta]
CQHYYSIPDSF